MSRALRHALLLAGGLALVLASPVLADGDDHVSRAGVCTKSSSSRLDLRRQSRSGGNNGPGEPGSRGDSRIDVTFTVRSKRSGVVWRVILLHERRIVYRGKLRTRPPKASFVLRHALADWYGSETVTARATSARGEVCRASARL
jgi:hypothetical protein